jgi:hypothetical protein
MSPPRIGPGIISGWCLDTFDATAIEEIAKANCPRLPVVRDPPGVAAGVAAFLNEASTSLLVSLTAIPGAADGKAGAEDLARHCSGVRAHFRPAAHRVALKLGLDTVAVRTMLNTLHQTEMAATQLAKAASRPNAKRPAAEGDFLDGIGFAYRRLFDRDPTTTRDRKTKDRSGDFGRFTAAVADRLLGDTRVTNTPASWRPTLQRFASAKKVAGRLEARRQPSFQE